MEYEHIEHFKCTSFVTSFFFISWIQQTDPVLTFGTWVRLQQHLSFQNQPGYWSMDENLPAFTREKRYQISVHLKGGYRQTEIACLLKIQSSTIYRELRRNRGLRGYRPRQAIRLFWDEPESDLPRWASQSINERSGSRTWRCKACVSRILRAPVKLAMMALWHKVSAWVKGTTVWTLLGGYQIARRGIWINRTESDQPPPDIVDGRSTFLSIYLVSVTLLWLNSTNWVRVRIFLD